MTPVLPLADDPHALIGLVVVVAVLALLAGLLRWTYGTQRDHRTPSGDGYGLLREVAVAPTAEAAERLCARLAAHHIRATVRPSDDGPGRHVLVWEADYHDARQVIAGHEADPG